MAFVCPVTDSSCFSSNKPRREKMDIVKHAGVDTVKLVMMIVQAARTVRHNKNTCQQLVHHVQIIGDLLEKLQTPEMMQHSEIRNGLNELEGILGEAYMLVTSCQNSNYIHHLITVFPLISHIGTADRLDKILEIVRHPHSELQAERDMPGLFTGCSSHDIRIEASSKIKRCSVQHAEAFKFSLFQLADATNNFSDENKIGQGSFGCVYKGQLHDGVEVAVKRCFVLPSPDQLDAQDLEFENEIYFLTKLEHTNIVKLVGACIHERQRVLVYEYMPNGSLNAFIADAMDWPTRSQIMKGIAEGLLYLHKHSGLHIIHGDLKPSNILLDTGMKPKISDFGFARTYNPGVDEEFADSIVGSMGFIAPECRQRRLFSIKSDVYGFGALLLEVISAKRCFSLAAGEYGDDYGVLNKRFWHLWKAGRLVKFANLTAGNASERREILRFIQIALLCVEENPKLRPTMQEVVHMLNCQNVALPNPQCPAYLRTEMV